MSGELANAQDHPWIVGIETIFWGTDESGVGGWYVATCTGTVISPTKVLTAGHCTVGYPFASTVVIAGRNDLDNSTGGFVARVSSTWTHQGFNVAQRWSGEANVPIDDVSVLTLKDQLPVAYTPVALSGQGDQTPYQEGTEALIVGYGITGEGRDDVGILRKATVHMQSDATCATEYGTDYDQNRMVCAGDPNATDPESGKDTCNGDSGGPILVNNVEVGITDWGPTRCGSDYGVFERLSYYADPIKADLTRPPLINFDWAGDGHTDLIARDSSGQLWEYSGSGFADDGYGGFAARWVMNKGWGIYTRIFRVYNWNGDKTPSIMAMTSSGDLYIYDTDGFGSFTGTRRLIGKGWAQFTAIVVTNNWLGDGRPSLIARKSNGDLMRYTSDGAGGWANPSGTRIGTGWNSFNLLLAPGAWRGDGLDVLIGRKSDGDLVLYQSDGKGGWTNPSGTLIGTGWGGFRTILTVGDWNGDNMMDMLGVTSGGAMRLYTTNGYGEWIDASGAQITAGWSSYSPIF